jgi:hypothetical protein
MYTSIKTLMDMFGREYVKTQHSQNIMYLQDMEMATLSSYSLYTVHNNNTSKKDRILIS